MLCSRFLLAICFIHGIVYMSMLHSPVFLPSLSLAVSTSPFSISVSPVLRISSPGSFFYIPHLCIDVQYLFFSDLLHSVQYALGSSASVQLTDSFLFCGWVIYVQQLLYPFICWWISRLPHVLAIVNSAAINTGLCVSFWIICPVMY